MVMQVIYAILVVTVAFAAIAELHIGIVCIGDAADGALVLNQSKLIRIAAALLPKPLFVLPDADSVPYRLNKIFSEEQNVICNTEQDKKVAHD